MLLAWRKWYVQSLTGHGSGGTALWGERQGCCLSEGTCSSVQKLKRRRQLFWQREPNSSWEGALRADLPVSLPTKIKLPSSGSLLAQPVPPTVAHLSQLEAKCCKLLLNFAAKFLCFLPFLPPNTPPPPIYTPPSWWLTLWTHLLSKSTLTRDSKNFYIKKKNCTYTCLPIPKP